MRTARPRRSQDGQAALEFGGAAAVTGEEECLRSLDPIKHPAGLASGWREPVQAFLHGVAGRGLLARLQERLDAGATVFPAEPLRALALTPLEQVRVVILGQDPYHGPGQAEGLAFSVRPGVRQPPSLRNIFVERQRDLGVPCPPVDQGSLVPWARQGVLLLNAVLTVEAARPASHAGWGWEALTDELVRTVASRCEPCVFLLWGGHAQARRAGIEAADPGRRHCILSANHPSPLSARRPPVPFIGCGHFGQARAFLASRARGGIDW